MADASVIEVPVKAIGIRRKARHSFVVIGNPNSGKSTLFNRLTGLRQTTGNYPGVTVEKHVGIMQTEIGAMELIDLPGIYCLGGQSLDERIAVDVILGRLDDVARPSGMLFVLDATHLYQGLYLLEQLLEMQVPTVVALTMTDLARARGITIDIDALQARLPGITVREVVSTRRQGIEALKQELQDLHERAAPDFPASWPALSHTAQELADRTSGELTRMDVIQSLLHPSSDAEARANALLNAGELKSAREELFGTEPPQAVEARQRYRWVRGVLGEVLNEAPLLGQVGARLGNWLNRPWPATVAFFALMALVFQAVFSWATPMMDAIDAGASDLGLWVSAAAGDGMLGSFLSDGLIAGVGSVIVFLPQILILFLFIIVLEDSGYLARAAFLMDRVMRTVGLSGQSVIPMLSSFACAVPAIMATRVIPDRRDRIATILAAPFMTCSARLPIYALLIAAFVPAGSLGWFNLQGIVLFGLYLLGIFGGLVTARLLKLTALRGPKPVFVLALPEFRKPDLVTVLLKLWDRVRVFLKRAGTVIFAVAVVVWVLAYFPRAEVVTDPPGPSVTSMQGPAGDTPQQQAEAMQLSQSWLGRMGRWVEPVFEPLGWDWRVSSAVIAGFPAREVVVAVLGTLYAVGSDTDEETLAGRLRSATWPDGRPVFTLPMVLGLLVFYAWCLQCAATLATIRRETNSWRWPIFAWFYMTTLGYVAALLIYQIGSRL
ncbi:ferrous iron transport protein B [Elongatibacter sediminis]|uniref:Ferrous iron transport protein B n=1 Tax=Elongatibacter sediminis TaxID=3119006 RepID=A0AAW9R6A3_9GAMM